MSEYEKAQKDLDDIERLLRKPVQKGKVETKIQLKNPEKYPKLWFEHQEDQDAYDSLMRKKIYFQNSYGAGNDKDFVLNGYRTTFGIFTKEFKERRFEMSDKLKAQNNYVKDMISNPQNVEKYFARYHTYSEYDLDKQLRINHLKVILFFLALRELPLRHFYARAFVITMGGLFVWFKHWQHGAGNGIMPTYYLHQRDLNEFANYPLLANIVLGRVTSRGINPTILEADAWWYFQLPVFYHHHFKHYRYVFRNSRVIPWDGTFNQPTHPYLHMGGSGRNDFVHNGLLEATEPKGSQAF